MKKYLLAVWIAMVVLLALPIAVSAGNTVAVSGTVPLSLDLNVFNTTPTFGTFSIGQNINWTPSTVNVTTSSSSWHVDVTSTGGGAAGYMYNTSKPSTMIHAFNMSKTSPAAPTWTQTTGAGWSNFMGPSGAGTYSQNVWVQQVVSPVDTSGIYTITATFTATAS